ncbi:hypothetical protein [Hyalangium versicolor]|uniref:hypothetical protein n=1 Tax=Hyalangium versicolor TaxID=2861190 RepID=UPI001CC93DDF|nr:hypothetical protein [Hyalangium versicolor]
MRPISSASSVQTSRKALSTGSAATGSATAGGKSAGSAASKPTSRGERLMQHQTNQLNRIQKGLSDSTLTADEAKGLAQKQLDIANKTLSALSDGKLDKGEFKELRQMQKGASRDIFEQRHNDTEQPVAAGERTSHIEGFQNNMSARIQKGISDGSLTSEEASKLMDGQSRIAEAKGSALADGTMDETEYSQLRELQRQASRDIFASRHNQGIKG